MNWRWRCALLAGLASPFSGCDCGSEGSETMEGGSSDSTGFVMPGDTFTDSSSSGQTVDSSSTSGSDSSSDDGSTTDTGTETGTGTETESDTDTNGDGPAVAQIVAGETFTCARIDDGRVRCWGRGVQGALGYGDGQTIGDDELPFEAGDVPLTEDDDPAVELAAGEWHVCARLASGAVQCWGDNEFGQTGHATGLSPIGDDETPASVGPVDFGGTAIRIAAGTTSTCVLLDDSNVRCWGHGALMQNDSAEPIGDDEPAAAAPLIDFPFDVVDLDTAGHFGCFRGSAGNVRCFGLAGGSGQSAGGLGYGNTAFITDPLAAVDVSIGGVATSIRLGRFHGCVTLEGGAARCWGSNTWGELGLGRPSGAHVGDDEVPTDVPALDFGDPVASLAPAWHFTCGVGELGDVKCWGRNEFGQLGQGHTEALGLDTSSAPTPADMAPLVLPRPALEVATGNRHACALLDDASVVCWGDGTYGALGYGSTDIIGDDEPADSGGLVEILD